METLGDSLQPSKNSDDWKPQALNGGRYSSQRPRTALGRNQNNPMTIESIAAEIVDRIDGNPDCKLNKAEAVANVLRQFLKEVVPSCPNAPVEALERMSTNPPETVIEVASHDLFAVLDILNAFEYESEEDSCMGMSFFKARLCEDSFFRIKRKLEEFLKSSENGQAQRRDVSKTNY
jgi:hypothetical protein